MLKYGDTIGIISPSHVADPRGYETYINGIERLGFRVKTGENLYKDTYGYTASTEERAADLNRMIRDETVKLIFFGGGYGSVDLIPYIDYQSLRERPKMFFSYSDGTSILNAVYAQTGVPVYYGQTPGLYGNVSDYDKRQFLLHFVEGPGTEHVPNSEWRTVTAGCCEGRLLGGYLHNFVLSLGNQYFPYRADEKYILFLEDAEKFRTVPGVSMLLSCLAQSPLMEQVTGLLLGHYAEDVPQAFFGVLERFGEKHKIPVAYCDDFGHGVNHAIIPIGRRAVLDTEKKTLQYK